MHFVQLGQPRSLLSTWWVQLTNLHINCVTTRHHEEARNLKFQEIKTEKKNNKSKNLILPLSRHAIPSRHEAHHRVGKNWELIIHGIIIKHQRLHTYRYVRCLMLSDSLPTYLNFTLTRNQQVVIPWPTPTNLHGMSRTASCVFGQLPVHKSYWPVQAQCWKLCPCNQNQNGWMAVVATQFADYSRVLMSSERVAVVVAKEQACKARNTDSGHAPMPELSVIAVSIVTTNNPSAPFHSFKKMLAQD